MKFVEIQYHKTSIGELILGSFEDKLCLLDYRYRKMRSAVNNRILKGLKANFVERDNQLLQKSKTQINEYLAGERTTFQIPVLPVGSPFQKQVWKALMSIPYGKTISYLQLSKTIGNEKAIRAVASANGANALALIIPCHRVIGSDGNLVGYAGGLNAKQKLLIIESQKHLFNEKKLFSDLN
jgi:methylated-DNA-[protein]-cysteine S-methyltransferase